MQAWQDHMISPILRSTLCVPTDANHSKTHFSCGLGSEGTSCNDTQGSKTLRSNLRLGRGEKP